MKTQIIIVTGASRGMGAAAARWLGKAKAGVVLAARSRIALEKVAEDIRGAGGDALVVDADMANADDCDRIVREGLDYFGRLDGIINNAGVLSPIAAIADCAPADFRRNLEINVMGPFFIVRAALTHLRKTKGRVVNVSSGAAVHPVEGWGAYCTSKAALTHFTKVLAVEEPQVTSVAIRPGVVDTDMQARIRSQGLEGMTRERVDYFRDLKTKGKLEPPWVPARAMAWLALSVPREWSGEFLEYDDCRITEPATALLGKALEK